MPDCEYSKTEEHDAAQDNPCSCCEGEAFGTYKLSVLGVNLPVTPEQAVIISRALYDINLPRATMCLVPAKSSPKKPEVQQAAPDTIADLRELRDRMVNLVRFADHRESCSTRIVRESACDCGYADALKGRSESHDKLCQIAKAAGVEPPKGPMSLAEIEAFREERDR